MLCGDSNRKGGDLMKLKYGLCGIVLCVILCGCAAEGNGDKVIQESSIPTKSAESVTKQEEKKQEYGYDSLHIGPSLSFLGVKYAFDYSGYISIADNVLSIKPIEWIDSDNYDRIAELELTEDDLISGYCIIDRDEDVLSFPINENTEYHFIDWGVDYVKKDEDQRIVTKDKELFLEYLNTYPDLGAHYPIFIILEDGFVKYVIEKPLV